MVGTSVGYDVPAPVDEVVPVQSTGFGVPWTFFVHVHEEVPGYFWTQYVGVENQEQEKGYEVKDRAQFLLVYDGLYEGPLRFFPFTFFVRESVFANDVFDVEGVRSQKPVEWFDVEGHGAIAFCWFVNK